VSFVSKQEFVCRKKDAFTFSNQILLGTKTPEHMELYEPPKKDFFFFNICNPDKEAIEEVGQPESECTTSTQVYSWTSVERKLLLGQGKTFQSNIDPIFWQSKFGIMLFRHIFCTA